MFRDCSCSKYFKIGSVFKVGSRPSSHQVRRAGRKWSICAQACHWGWWRVIGEVTRLLVRKITSDHHIIIIILQHPTIISLWVFHHIEVQCYPCNSFICMSFWKLRFWAQLWQKDVKTYGLLSVVCRCGSIKPPRCGQRSGSQGSEFSQSRDSKVRSQGSQDQRICCHRSEDLLQCNVLMKAQLIFDRRTQARFWIL